MISVAVRVSPRRGATRKRDSVTDEHPDFPGLCQNVPITGPGTFLGYVPAKGESQRDMEGDLMSAIPHSTVLGSLVLLGFARTWKTETPYTLGCAASQPGYSCRLTNRDNTMAGSNS